MSANLSRHLSAFPHIRARNPEQNINTDLTLPDGSQWCMGYSYDENGNLQPRTDARKIATSYTYDDLNRPKTRTYAAPAGVPATPPVSFYYDNAQALPSGAPSFSLGASVGKLVAVLYGGSSSTTGNYTGYDAIGRPIVSFQKTDTSVYRMDYGYDLSGELISETYPGTAGNNRRVVRTEYDAAGRIAGIRNGATGPYYAGDAANRIAYASHGAISRMKLGNGLWEHTDFNSRLQPTQIGLGTAGSGLGSTSVLGLDYTYGVMAGAVLDATKNNGNIESQTINAGGLTLKQSYTYDQVNRLLTAEEIRSGAQPPQQWKQAFTYDRFGNRNFDLPNTTGNVIDPNSNPTIDPATNRLQGSSYGYDTAGNLSSDPTTNPNAILYDGENRQVSYTKPGGGTTDYSYDGDGRRVKKVDSGTTVFVYDVSAHLIAEYTTAPPSGPGGTSYLTTDHLGSTRVVTTAGPSPTVKARYDYLPFGDQIASTIGNRSTVAGYVPNDSTRQKFTQKERDSESGLDYFLARYYSAVQGRFTSADEPLSGQYESNPQTWNLYSYTANNPSNRVDVDGRRWYQKAGELPKWVEPNSDGSYTSPGEGWIPFIPTGDKIRTRAFPVFFNNGRTVVYFGEDKSGNPFVEELATGKVEDQSVQLVALGYVVFRGGPLLGAIYDELRSHFSRNEGNGGVGANRLEYQASSKHHPNVKGDVGQAPTNGQAALGNSVRYNQNSPRRVGIDNETGEFVIFDQTSPGVYHGHVRTWEQLPQAAKNALNEAGMVTRRGKIQ